MLRNFLTIAFRNIYKNALYSSINIFGLAIGIMCTILIVLWVIDEISYDRFIPKSDRLYQVYVNAEFDGKINTWRSVPLPTYEEMKVRDNNLIRSAVTGWGAERLIRYGETRMMKDGLYVSEEFLEMFEFPLLYGDKESVLDEPKSIILTESTARALFGEEDPMNKIVKVSDAYDLTVTGILKDLPGNSTFQFDFLMPWKHREQVNEWIVDNLDNWGNYSFQIFVELDDPKHLEKVDGSIYNVLTEKGETDIKRWFFLHPMEEWRLRSNFEGGRATGGLSDYVQLMSVIAIFILLIACINFMNLATARSEKRVKEVGIRKSIGSNRRELVLQFIGESTFIALISFILAVLMTLLVLPSYNEMVEKQLSIDFSSPVFWVASLAVVLITGLVAGSYPAFYLSKFQPADTLKGTISGGKGGSLPRKILVTLQFTFSILLMIGSVVIYNQIRMVQQRELGYDQENLIAVEFTEALRENYDPLKTELMQSGFVEGVTRSNSQITQVNSNNFLGWPGKPEDLKVIFTTITAEYDYAETMGIEVLMGRDFSKDFASDTGAIVINKAALDLMDLEEPIGTELDLWGSKKTLIGVLDNVLMESLYREVKPLFVVLQDWGGYISVRLSKRHDVQTSLAEVKSIFEKHNPAYPFDYRFADVEFQRKFTIINLTQKLATIFSLLAFIITGLGLFGLAAFTAEQKTKEIGIRKVLGASVPSLVAMMSKDFSRLVIISFLIAAPAAWFLLDKYLDRYPLRIDLEWWVFALVGLVTMLFAIVIVANQAFRAAQSNPVNSLRNE